MPYELREYIGDTQNRMHVMMVKEMGVMHLQVKEYQRADAREKQGRILPYRL